MLISSKRSHNCYSFYRVLRYQAIPVQGRPCRREGPHECDPAIPKMEGDPKSRPLDSPTVFSKHDILIHGSLFTVGLTGGRHASPDRHDRKETIACPPKTTSTRRRGRSPRRRSRDLLRRNEAR